MELAHGHGKKNPCLACLAYLIPHPSLLQPGFLREALFVSPSSVFSFLFYLVNELNSSGDLLAKAGILAEVRLRRIIPDHARQYPEVCRAVTALVAS